MEAEVLPRDDHEQREHHDVGVAQPVLDERPQADALQARVDQGVGLQEQAEDDAGDRLGQHVRDEEEQPEDGAAREAPVEQHGEPERERDLERAATGR